MNSAQTTVTVIVNEEVSSGPVATTATTAIEIASDPSWWQTIIQFLSSLF